ncbi:MAG: molybdate ABC transporter substrate-binding protein [Candidatus Nanopelagicales bacterium]
MRPSLATLLAPLVGVAALAACTSGVAGAGTASVATPGGDPRGGAITVFAAASLLEAFTTLGGQFESVNPGVQVVLSFAGSSALAAQITDGAPVDVFAAASPATMDRVVGAGLATDPTPFARNSMQIAVPAANRAGVASLCDLADPSVKVAICQPQVPCGAAAAQVLGNASVTVQPVTLDPDVKSVLGRVRLGEVDAGIVYVTDVIAAGKGVKGVDIPTRLNATASYPIVALSGSPNPVVAAAFVEFVLSPAGEAGLRAAGFEVP